MSPPTAHAKLSVRRRAMSGRAPPETLLRDALEAARRENSALQNRVRELEASVSSLTRTVFLLSTDPSSLPAPRAEPLPVPSSEPAASATESTSSFAPPPQRARPAVDGVAATPSQLTSRPSSTGTGIRDGFTPFVERIDLKAHTAAVYALRFSSDGANLATVSFDRSAVIWGIDSDLGRKDMTPLLSISDAHRAPVVAVEWVDRSAGSWLVTGGFDASAAVWDVDVALTYPVSRYHTRGIVNAVSTSTADPFVFFSATARRAVHRFDRRVRPRASDSQPQPNGTAAHGTRAHSPKPLVTQLPAAARGVHDESTVVVDNDSAVNTVYVESDGRSIITGDHSGAIKTWDLRLVSPGTAKREKPAGLVSTNYNDADHRPITHVHSSPAGDAHDTGRCLAVNSYDNFLRVYDRGAFLFGSGVKSTDLKPLHNLRGVINRNWPIKSSFFVGPNYRPPRAVARRPPRARRSGRVQPGTRVSHGTISRENCANDSRPESLGRDRPMENTQNSSSELDSEGDQDVTFDSTSDEDDDGSDLVGRHGMRKKPAPYRPCDTPIQEALLLASGSADGLIYVFDVGGSAGTGGIVQTIRGHRDRVHSVDFHPTERILASCSADTQVKIWTPGKVTQ